MSVIAKAFDARLNHEALIILLLLAITAIVFNVIKARQIKSSVWTDSADGQRLSLANDDRADKRVLNNDTHMVFIRIIRVGFASLWILDGILQMQTSMPFGLPTSVVKPSEAGSPLWLQHLVNDTLVIWERHPITDATGIAWIQLGIGLFILLAPTGLALRIAGATSALWAFWVWIFGESMGSIFAPHPSWLFGTPGAASLYFLGGILLALPNRYLLLPSHQKLLAKIAGAYFLVMTVIQIWPDNGYWDGKVNNHNLGQLANQVHQMSLMNQPGWIKSLLGSGTHFLAGNSFVINLIVIGVLGFTALSFMTVYKNLWRYSLILLSILTIITWIFFQDFGFIGGLGTDPNSMLPTLILVSAIYYINKGNLVDADVRVLIRKVSSASSYHLSPNYITKRIAIVSIDAEGETGRPIKSEIISESSKSMTGKISAEQDFVANNASEETDRRSPSLSFGIKTLLTGFKKKPLATQFRLFTSFEAILIVALGVIPMSLSIVNYNVSPIVNEAYNGIPTAASGGNAHNFTLTGTDGGKISLSQYRNKIVFLTFLDPVCLSDCPLIAQEIKRADILLGSKKKFVEFIAVDENPLYTSVAYTKAFDQEEQMTNLPNWQYLTANSKTLTQVWNNYGITATYGAGGEMVVHSEIAYLIGVKGKIKEIFDDSPILGNNLAQTSFVNIVDSSITKYLPYRKV